jgi:outer membrane protein TolC
MVTFAQNSVEALSLAKTIDIAIKQDPWLVKDKYSQSALESQSIAVGTLPDPKVSIGIANIAADSFDFNQERMTQFKVGVSQMFPRGDTLSLKQKQFSELGERHPFLREDRKAKLTVMVSKLWLDAYRAQQSIVLIEKDRSLFEQLADVAEASYSSAVGKTRQQDIVRAELELTRLEDRLTMLNQQQDVARKKLSEWLGGYFYDEYSDSEGTATSIDLDNFRVSSQLPNLKLINSDSFDQGIRNEPSKLLTALQNHPAMLAIEKQIDASKTAVSIAKQKYKPEWGLNASYGYRENDPIGNSRADLFSIGITFDVPLFTGNRQDKQVRSAISSRESMKTEKWMVFRKFIADIESLQEQLKRTIERQKLYKDKLLPQMHDQAEASLTAYTNDDGDFSEVVRARIAELNAQIDGLNIDVKKQQIIVQLNYYFMQNFNEIAFELSPGENHE